MAKHSETAKNEARAQLRKWLKPGDTVHTILDHVSSSGMSRDIRVVIVRKDGTILHPNHSVSVLLDLPRAKRGDGMRIGGCGSDMGFEIVYRLGRVMFPEGFKVKGTGRNGDTSGHDNDGGYALKHKWL